MKIIDLHHWIFGQLSCPAFLKGPEGNSHVSFQQNLIIFTETSTMRMEASADFQNHTPVEALIRGAFIHVVE
jgi:hypothetical protein